MTRRGKALLIFSLAVAAAAVLTWYFVFRSGRDEKPQAPAAAPAAQVGSLSLSTEMQENAGIRTANPEPFTYREEARAYVAVLDPSPLSDLRSNYLAAEAGAEKTKAALAAAREEYGRMKALYGEKNVSGKAFQSTEASFRANEADYAAASDILRSVELSADQQWGGTIGGWIKHGSGAFQRLARREEVLLQVTLPQGYNATTVPAGLKLILPSGRAAKIEFISPATRTDPRVQGISYFYVASAEETGLIPGMSASAVFPSGPPARGLLVPGSAVVWWQGRAWAYVKTGADTFTRREVPTEEPADGGWFVSKGFSPADEIVVKGAETLLSQEFLAKPAAGKEEDDED